MAWSTWEVRGSAWEWKSVWHVWHIWVCLHTNVYIGRTDSPKQIDRPLINLIKFSQGLDVDSQCDNLWESPLPVIFCLLMGLAQGCILLQKVITWPVLWELIVMGLDFAIFFIWRLCCLSWPSPSQDQQLAVLGKCCALISCTREKCEEVSV